MSKPMMEYAVAAAIESYIHAPRALTLSKVVRQLTAVFPDQDHAMPGDEGELHVASLAKYAAAFLGCHAPP